MMHHPIETVIEIVMLLVLHYVFSRIKSKWGSFLTITDSGLFVFQKPKSMVALGAVICGLVGCLACFLLAVGIINGQGLPLFVIAAVLAAIGAFLLFLYGPEKVEVDVQSSRYRHYKGWFGGVRTGSTTDIVGVTVIDNPHSGVAACKLNWASGQSTMVGIWWSGLEKREKAMELADMVKEYIGAPITTNAVGFFKSTKTPE